MNPLVLFVVTAVWDMSDVMEGCPDAHYRSLNGPNPRSGFGVGRAAAVLLQFSSQLVCVSGPATMAADHQRGADQRSLDCRGGPEGQSKKRNVLLGDVMFLMEHRIQFHQNTNQHSFIRPR